MAIKNFAFKPMGSFLQDNTYFIPDYQREYSWENSQINDFWNDLTDLVVSKESDHFFGQIVVQNEEAEGDKKYIIDGQQRTTTSVIFLSAINTIFLELAAKGSVEAQEISEDIKIKYIGRWTSANDRLLLKLSNVDGQFFRNYIQTRNIVEPTMQPGTKAQKRMVKAYEYFHNNLLIKIKEENTEMQFKILNDCYLSFINGFKVMYVETSSLEEAFIIFESLNARGKGLETADLLKNHFFKESKGQIENVKSNWEDMLNNLGDGDTTKFIRYYWNSQEKFVRTQSLYKEMKKKVRNENDCLNITRELKGLSEVYSFISQKDSPSVFSNNNLNQIINNLKLLGVSAFYPIVLAMSNKDWEESDMVTIMAEIEKLIFRNIIIGKEAGNKFENFFSDIAILISQGDKGINALLAIITSNKISDDEFKGYFEKHTTHNKPVIRYIFKKINNLHSSKEMIISDSNDVHIEHIMPITKGEWVIEENDHKDNLWRIGNLTLLGNEYNKKISNKLFGFKKEMYEKSEIFITKELLKYDEWNLQTILERQKKLTEDALEIW